MKYLLVFYLIGTHSEIFHGNFYSSLRECQYDGDERVTLYNGDNWNRMIYYRCEENAKHKKKSEARSHV